MARASRYERDLLPGMMLLSDESIERARAFALSRWQQRWHEVNRSADVWRALAERGDRTDITSDYYEPPHDLSGSCKFTSMFARQLFGGALEGNYHHQYVRTATGAILDLNDQAMDVTALGAEAYHHDPLFWGKPEHRASMESCKPRVDTWVSDFMREIKP